MIRPIEFDREVLGVSRGMADFVQVLRRQAPERVHPRVEEHVGPQGDDLIFHQRSPVNIVEARRRESAGQLACQDDVRPVARET